MADGIADLSASILAENKEMSDLLQRLHDVSSELEDCRSSAWAAVVREAADEISALRAARVRAIVGAENDQLRAALEPFAAVCDAEHMKYVNDDQVLELSTRAEVPVSEKLRGRDFRRAKAALTVRAEVGTDEDQTTAAA
jgi:hypothetical protein